MIVQVGDAVTDAILDTGGVWLVLSPTDAEFAGVHDWAPLTSGKLGVRGRDVSGRTYSAPVLLLAEEGCSVAVELTVFVPDVPDADKWDLPTFLGWQGCLNRFPFALGAEAERFHFGVIGTDQPGERDRSACVALPHEEPTLKLLRRKRDGRGVRYL